MVGLEDPARKLLQTTNFAQLATVRKDGSAAVTPTWFDFDAERVLLNGAKGRMWVRNVERDPRVTVAISALDNPYECVVLRGVVAPTEIDGKAHHDALRRRYRGRDGGDFDFGERIVFGLKVERANYRHEPPPGSGAEYEAFLAARLGAA